RAIRTVLAADVRPFVPVEAQPAQVLEHAGFGFPGRSLLIGVLDAENERAALAAREQPVEERGAGVANVQVAGWTWSETDAHPHRRSEAGGRRSVESRTTRSRATA